MIKFELEFTKRYDDLYEAELVVYSKKNNKYVEDGVIEFGVFETILEMQVEKAKFEGEFFNLYRTVGQYMINEGELDIG